LLSVCLLKTNGCGLW